MSKERDLIPLSVPNLSGNELEYVTAAIRSQWVSTAGAEITQFEERFAERLGVTNACACQSGTAGLHLCLRHFGIGPGDLVLVPTLTFAATINAVVYQQAVPVFFDCDEAMCIDVDQISRYLAQQCEVRDGRTVETATGRHVKAIVPVHVFGDLCDMEAIMELSREYHLAVIEDATESLGSIFGSGRFSDKQSGTVGHAGVFSFNGNKIITTGGGGMIVSDDAYAIAHMRYLSQQAKDDPVRFVHNEVGYNYRMTNLQAALGLAQLEQLDGFIRIKCENYEHYRRRLESYPLGKLQSFREPHSNKWFYSFVLGQPDEERRDALMAGLEQRHIQVRPIWRLNHMQKPFEQYPAQDCPRALTFYRSVINLPCSTNLSLSDVETVCRALYELA